MMFIPGAIGLLFMSVLMFLALKKNPFFDIKQKQTSFKLKILAFVFGMSRLLFVASYLGIPIVSQGLFNVTFVMGANM